MRGILNSSSHTRRQAEQHARGDGGGARPEQAYARSQSDEGAEIDQGLTRGNTLRHPCPGRGEIALDQAQDSQGDHRRRKKRMAPARDPHYPVTPLPHYPFLHAPFSITYPLTLLLNA